MPAKRSNYPWFVVARYWAAPGRFDWIINKGTKTLIPAVESKAQETSKAITPVPISDAENRPVGKSARHVKMYASLHASMNAWWFTSHLWSSVHSRISVIFPIAFCVGESIIFFLASFFHLSRRCSIGKGKDQIIFVSLWRFCQDSNLEQSRKLCFQTKPFI